MDIPITLGAMYNLGYTGMLGLLRAKRDGIITAEEYETIKKHLHENCGVPLDWFRTLVWSC